MSYKALLALFFSIILIPLASARSGCCSSHGGVVGCGCGDGTPLSATCAPYYPQCNKPAAPVQPVKKTSSSSSTSSVAPVVLKKSSSSSVARPSCVLNIKCKKGFTAKCSGKKAVCKKA